MSSFSILHTFLTFYFIASVEHLDISHYFDSITFSSRTLSLNITNVLAERLESTPVYDDQHCTRTFDYGLSFSRLLGRDPTFVEGNLWKQF